MRKKPEKLKQRRLVSVIAAAISILAVISIFISVSMLSKANVLKFELSKFLALNGSLQENVEALTQSVRGLEEENKRLKNRNAELEDAIEELKRRNEELEQANLALQQQIEQRRRSYRTEVLHGLVDIQELDPSIIVDLRYASNNNFMGFQIYPDNSRAYLRRETAVKLLQASEIFKKDGYYIKIWDAYRPLSAQKIMWEHSPLPGYIANPDNGSKHNRGAAVDITLVDKEGNELEMPTGFDDFTEKAARDYPHHSAEAKKNMDYLTQVMNSCGFKGIRTEWWHFEDIDARNYPLLDIGLDSF
ncbi:MAG TPA: D-alanyl-D-alanine dipeptidase [Clostridiales bacterium]|nr:D-alanyl-D-alanine dipeptidase [Clostridiales bacterium]